MARRKRRKFTAEFKADAVRLVTTGSKTIAEVTKQFDLTETALRGWVRRAETDRYRRLHRRLLQPVSQALGDRLRQSDGI